MDKKKGQLDGLKISGLRKWQRLKLSEFANLDAGNKFLGRNMAKNSEILSSPTRSVHSDEVGNSGFEYFLRCRFLFIS